MSDITKEDLNRVYDKIDDITSDVQTTREAVIRIETKFENYSQPCKNLVEHIGSHHESRRVWKTSAISMIFDFIKIATVATITAIITALRINKD